MQAFFNPSNISRRLKLTYVSPFVHESSHQGKCHLPKSEVDGMEVKGPKANPSLVLTDVCQHDAFTSTQVAHRLFHTLSILACHSPPLEARTRDSKVAAHGKPGSPPSDTTQPNQRQTQLRQQLQKEFPDTNIKQGLLSSLSTTFLYLQTVALHQ